jgi:hypothetical protein
VARQRNRGLREADAVEGLTVRKRFNCKATNKQHNHIDAQTLTPRHHKPYSPIEFVAVDARLELVLHAQLDCAMRDEILDRLLDEEVEAVELLAHQAFLLEEGANDDPRVGLVSLCQFLT